MDIQELKAKKETLEKDIAGLIRSFNEDTGVYINDIEVITLEMAYGGSVLAGVKVKADL